MKRIKLILLSLGILCTGTSSAQVFTVIKATSQRWTGGVVGRHGVKYHIEIEAAKKAALPDTLWINGFTYPLDFFTKNANCMRTTDSATGKIIFNISVAESHTEKNWGHRPPVKDTATVTPKPSRQYEGAALISYSLKNIRKKKSKSRQFFFIINSFTELTPLNYP